MPRRSWFLVWLVLPLAPARGATFTVTDVGDPAPPAAICGRVSQTLRDAVRRANLTPEPDEVLVAVSPVQLVAACGELLVTAPLVIRQAPKPGVTTLDPAAAVIAGQGNRVFRVADTASSAAGADGPLRLEALTVRAGDAQGEPGCGPAGLGGGGAVCNQGDVPVQIAGSVLESNLANYGGALAGPAVVQKSTLRSNLATVAGGGIWIGGGTLQVTASTLAENKALGTEGGGIAAGRVAGAATLDLTIATSTLNGNQAAATGGALSIGDVTSAALENVTVGANTSGGNGGGIVVRTPAATASLVHVTAIGNVAGTGGGGVYVDVDAGLAPLVANSLLVDNRTGNAPNQCVGAFAGASTGNLVADDDTSSQRCTASSVLDDRGRRFSAAAVAYEPLGVTTGTTATYDLRDRSEAHRKGDARWCTCADQRGERRGDEPDQCAERGKTAGFRETACTGISDPCAVSVCDIGAVEHRLDCDRDGVPQWRDNCREKGNADQVDTDGDCVGDVCDCVTEATGQGPAGGEPGDADQDSIANGEDCCQSTVPIDGYPPAWVDERGCAANQLCACSERLVFQRGKGYVVPWPSSRKFTTCLRDAVRTVVPKSQRRQRKAYLADLQASLAGCPTIDPAQQRTDPDADGLVTTPVINEPRDNCPKRFNPSQSDCDADGRGDSCDGDADGDGVRNGDDRCPFIPSPTPRVQHADADNDGFGNECDCCPFSASEVGADVDARGCEEDQAPRDPATLAGCTQRAFDAKRYCGG